MSWIDTLLTKLHIKQIKPVGRAQYSESDLLFSRRYGINTQVDQRTLIAHNRGLPYVCASRNAETIAGIPLRLYVRGAMRNYYQRRSLGIAQKSYIAQVIKQSVDDVEEIIDGHPLLDLIRNVNSELTQSQLMEITVLYLELLGNAYWYLEPGPLGLPIAIWPLMSQYVRVVRDSDGELVGYLYGKSDTNRIALDKTEVIHFKYPNPANPDYGLGCLEAVLGSVKLMESQQEYLSTHYDQGGLPEVGLVVNSRLLDEDRKRLYSEWHRRFASRRKGEKFIILEGDVDLKTFGYPPIDSGIEFAQRFSREEIAAAFGIPLTMLQLNEASRAGAEAGHYAYMKYTIAPKLQRIQEKLNEQLAARFDERLFFVFDNPVPEDRNYDLREIETHLKYAVRTINEVRSELGLPPVPWGDIPMNSAGNRQPMETGMSRQSENERERESENETETEERSIAKLMSPNLNYREQQLQRDLNRYLVDFARVTGELIRENY